MARRFAVPLPALTAVDNDFLGGVFGTTAVRPKLYEFIVGGVVASAGAPVDGYSNYELERTTSAGATPTAITPNPLDSAETPAVCTAAQTFATDPTQGAILMNVPLNMRATFRWIAAPGAEIVGAASTNGLGLRFDAPNNTFQAKGVIYFEE